jgi:hypothetical protein
MTPLERAARALLGTINLCPVLPRPAAYPRHRTPAPLPPSLDRHIVLSRRLSARHDVIRRDRLGLDL